MSAIREQPEGSLARQMASHRRPEISERVLRITLEGLVVADVARSIPEDVNLPRALTDRLAPELPLLHGSIGTNHALMTAMPARARANLTRRVREHPDGLMDVASWIDGHAAIVGTSAASRLELRRAAVGISARMRRQSASAVIDDYSGKVERAVVRSGGSLERTRSAVTAAMTMAIWQDVDDSLPLGGLGDPGAPAPVQIVEHEEAPPREREQLPYSEGWDRPGDSEMQVGAIMMPFGVLTCGVLLVVGLIAGAVQNEEWDGTTEAEEYNRHHEQRQRNNR